MNSTCDNNIMQQLQKYKFEASKPLTAPYNKDGIFNAYYKGVDTELDRDVLISEYSETRYQRIISKQKRLQKMKEIKHKNITQIYDIILDKENKRMFVVLQWCLGGNLYDYEKSISSVDCDLAVKVLLELMKGLKQIHKADQIHRHINMENVQFDEKGVPKLSFKCLYPKIYYMSPEDIQGTRNKQNDVFSLGVLFYKMLYGQIPFKGNGIDQQIRAIQEGAKFGKDSEKMFPISIPIQAKNLIINMTMPKCQDRWSDDVILQECQKYLKKMCKCSPEPESLPAPVLKKIFSNQQFIPLYVRHSSSQQYIIVAIHPSKLQLTKFHIFKSKSKKDLNQYVQKVLEPYRDVKDEMEIVPIYQNFIFDDEYLVIRSFYDNQGSLKYYLDRSGTISPQNAKSFIDKLLEKLKRYGRTHNHLTNNNILIRGGNFYINYPPFMTKQYLNSLKNSKNDVGFLAPQVKQGKSSQNADAWSVAMLKYMLENEEMPKFDKNGKLILNKGNRSDKDMNFYQNALIKDPQQRKGLADIYKDPVVEPSQADIVQIAIDSPKVVKPSTSRINPSTSRINPPNQPPPSIVRGKQQRKTFGQHLSQKFKLFYPLEKHWTKPIRVGIKCLIGLILLIFLFYFNFFAINGKLLTQHSQYQQKAVNIRGFSSDSSPQIIYNLVTKTPTDTFNLFYNKTLSVLRDDYKCVLNDYSVQSDVVKVINTSAFNAYQIFGVLFTIFNLIIFCVSLSKMDFPKIYFISKLEENNFNELWNWVFVNMALITQISFIYLLYGSLFHMALQPCLSKATLTAVQFLLKQWNFSFNIRYIWIYLGLVFSYMVIIFFIVKPQYVVHRVLKAILVALYLAGTFSRIMGGSGGYVAWEKESVFGKVGELLLAIIGVLFLTLDAIFGCCLKSQQYAMENKVENQDSNAEINPTQQNFLPQ